MSTVIVKLKDNGFKKLMSEAELFSLNNMEQYYNQSVEYQLSGHLGENLYYRIDNFSQQEFYPQGLDAASSSLETYKDGIDVNQMEYLVEESNNWFHFQRITKSSFIKDRIFEFGDSVKKIEKKDYIMIKENPDAIYDKSKDVLYFKDLRNISSMFPKINDYYKEASQSDIDDIIQNADFISSDSELDATKLSILSRKRIMLSKEKMSLFNKNKSDFVEYLKVYADLEQKGDQFIIKNETELKSLLNGLEEKYYTTKFSEEDRVAEAVTKTNKSSLK